MQKRTLRDPDATIRRRSQRRRIFGALHDICLKIELLQTTEDARRACREVAHMLKQARKREAVLNPEQKS